MKKYFNPDNPIQRALGRLLDLICLNAVFLLTCLPIITIGAALTALYSQTLKMIRKEDTYPVRSYFREFKEDFSRSTLLWLPGLGLLLFLSADLYLIYRVLDPSWRILQYPIWLMIFAVTAVLLYAFPLTARYRESYGQTIRNALRLAFGNLFLSIFFVIVLFLPLDLSFHNGVAAVFFFSLLLFCGAAVIAYFFSIFLNQVFEKASQPADSPAKSDKRKSKSLMESH